MFVYGIKCAPELLRNVSTSVSADYYMDYGLLVFPNYTKTTCVDSHGYLGSYFWTNAKLIIENPMAVVSMDFEHPWISDEEQDLVSSLPLGTETAWFYVPMVA
jgi:hypothetical protein